MAFLCGGWVRRTCSMALLSLVVLVIQNSLLVVLTRFSRSNVSPEDNYYTSTLILNQECVKMLMCLILFAFDEAPRESGDGGKDTALPHNPNIKINSSSANNEDVTAMIVVSVEDGSFGGTPTAVGDSPGNHSSKGRGKSPSSSVLPHSSITSTTTMRTNVVQSAAAAAAAKHSSLQWEDPQEDHIKEGKALLANARPQSFLCLPRRPMTLRQYFRRLRTSILKRDTMLLLLPQILFTMQNFLIFVGLSNLEVVSFQVWSQTKLLSAALFSVWLLHRHLTRMQWGSLGLLTLGVLVTQLNAMKTNTSAALTSTATTSPTSTTSTTSSSAAATQLSSLLGDQLLATHGNELLGIVACVLSGLSSSYAGVYFEKVVKTTSPTLAIRNIQLSLFGIPLAVFSMLVLDVLPNLNDQHLCGQPVHWNFFAAPPADWRDSATVKSFAVAARQGLTVSCPVKPFHLWQHYDAWLTWALVTVHAFGGLLVAVVVRYADNILKGFATGVSVITSGLLSALIWGYQPSSQFVIGALLVTASTILFHKSEKKQPGRAR